MLSTHHPAPRFSAKPLLAGSLIVALAGILFDFKDLKTFLSQPTLNNNSYAQGCPQIVETEAQITREQLAQLLTIPERDAKTRVREVVKDPFCQYPTIKVRSGVEAEREAYPLAFDPKTTIVILYENDEYAGYRFSFQ